MKRNTLLKLVTSIALVAALLLGMALPAFAQSDPGWIPFLPTPEGGYVETQAAADRIEASIMKHLEVPMQTDLKELSFTFYFEKVGLLTSRSGEFPNFVDGVDDSIRTLARMPFIGSQTVNFAAEEADSLIGGAGQTALINDGGLVASKDIIQLYAETENFLENITGEDFPGVGVYKYTVKERLNTNALHVPPAGAEPGDADDWWDTVTYSRALYDIEIWVNENDSGELYIQYLITKTSSDWREIDRAYNVSGTQTEAESNTSLKVDPTPDGDNSGDNETGSLGSEVIFTNAYKRHDGTPPPDPEDPDPEYFNYVLEISKEVKGFAGDLTKYFPFEVKVSSPQTIDFTGNEKYRAYIVLSPALDGLVSDGNVVDNMVVVLSPISSDNWGGAVEVDELGYQYIEFTSGVAQTVNLKHGQSLLFTDLVVGSEYEATELLSTVIDPLVGYTPSYRRTYYDINTNLRAVSPVVNGTKNANQKAGPFKLTQDSTNKRLPDRVAFTNTADDITPTGILVSDLPFIVMIGLGVLALAAFVVVKARKREDA